MANMMFKLLIAQVLVSLVLLQLAHADEKVTTTSVGSTPLPPSAKIDCGAECARRCALSSRPNLCNRACGTCCKRCNCVPPGTYGHYEACPCYASLKTHGGRPKCP